MITTVPTAREDERLAVWLWWRQAHTCPECYSPIWWDAIHWQRQFSRSFDAMTTVIKVVCPRCSHQLVCVETSTRYLETWADVLGALEHAVY